MHWYKKFRHIFLIAIIFFVVTFFQTFGYLSYSKSIIQEQTNIAFREQAESVRIHFQQKIGEQFMVLEAFADYVVKEDDISKENVFEFGEYSDFLNGFQQVGIADAETGEAEFQDGVKVNVSDKDYYKEALQGSRSMHFFQKEGSETETLILSVPIYRGDELKSVLIALVDTNEMEKYILSGLYEGKGVFCVTDKLGNIIGFRPQNNHFEGQNNVLNFLRSKNIDAETILNDGGDQEAMFRYGNDEGMWQSFYIPLEINNWFLYCSVPDYIVTQYADNFDATKMNLILKMLLINIVACILIYFLIRNAKAAVEKENNCLRTAEEVAGMISFEGDYRKDTFVVNNNYSKQFGRNPVMHKISDFAKPHPFVLDEDQEIFLKMGQGLIEGRETGNAQYRLLGKDGNIQWHQCVYRVWYDRHGAPMKCYGMIVPIDQQMKVISKLQMQVEKDPLTGVLNRMAFEIYVNLSLNGELREQNHALLLLDLDDFKQINDGYGHVLGDHVLVATADLLKACVRNSDYVGRLGGDEFAVFLKNANKEQAAKKASEICEALEKEEMKSNEATVTCSIGIACFPQNGEDFNDLYLLADRALYQVKGTGKNSFMVTD